MEGRTSSVGLRNRKHALLEHDDDDDDDDDDDYVNTMGYHNVCTH
jgi:hypothetical protein